MCGIFAAYNNERLNSSKSYYNEFRDCLAHRGPDNKEIFVSKKVYLGFNRLKIIDLSEAANMPMTDTSGRFVLVFNGQIYNYKELKETYLSDCEFQSKSDSEVILNGYKKYGANFFDKLDGMWALIIYDKVKDKLIISRDRFGVKFLYYCKIDNEIYFASEKKALISLFNKVNKPIRVNLNYAINFFVKGNNDYKNETFYEEIFSINEGSVLEYKNNFTHIKKLFEFNFEKKNKFNKEIFNNLLKDNIKKYSSSDVPISSTLSSGIDSSVIFFSLRQFINKKITSFTLKFNFFPDPEASIVMKIANKYKFENNFAYVNKKNLKLKFDNFLNMMDEPFVSDNLFYQSILTEEVAKQKFKVLFVGDGADEFFLGYYKYYYIYLLHNLKLFKISKLFNAISNNKLNITFFSFIKYALKNFIFSHGERNVLINDYGKKILNSNLKKKINLNYYKINKKFKNILDKEIYTRFKYDILKFNKNLDISGMMNSVEIRVPFLDHKLINYLLSINYDLHFEGGKNKSILRSYAQNHVPSEIIEQNNKFHKPGSIEFFVYQILNDDIYELFKSDISKKLFIKDLKKAYERDKKSLNRENSFIWFRYYQIIKLIHLKKLEI